MGDRETEIERDRERDTERNRNKETDQEVKQSLFPHAALPPARLHQRFLEQVFQ